MPEQTTAGELFEGDRSVLVARVNGELRDLAHVLADGDVVEPVTAAEQDGLDVLRHSAAHVLAQAVQEVHPDARLGIGPPIRDGFYYDFDVETPFTPDDLRALEKVMQRIVNEGQTFQRREISDDDALVELAGEPYKCELIGLKGGASETAAEGASRRGGWRPADHLRQRAPRRHPRVGRPVPRPARAHHQGARQRLQADAQRRRLLARLGEEPAAAARLRHRVADQGRDEGLPRPAGRGREARPPQARRRARPVQLPRRAGLGPGGVPPQGRRHQARDGGLRPPPAHRGGLPVRRHPPHQQGRAVPHLGAPALLRRHHVPADGVRGHRVPPQGDELPDAQPHLPLARALLPRAAAAPVRVRLGLPVREVRRRARPDPGARHDPGRLAQLRHRRAGAGRDQAPARLRAVAAARLRDGRLLPRAVHPRDRGRQEGQVHRLRRASGRSPPRCCATSRPSPASSSCSTRVAPRTTARRSRCRRATPSAAPGRCRPSSTTSTSRPASASSTRRPTAPASSR